MPKNDKKEILKDTIKFSLSEIDVDNKSDDIMIVQGTIATVGVPSDAPPCGSGGRQVVLSKKACNSKAQSFVGMPVNCVYGWGVESSEVMSGHAHAEYGYGSVIGFISEVEVKGKELRATMNIWKHLYYGLSDFIQNTKESLGFSIEIDVTSAYVDVNGYAVVDDFNGVGCSMLWKNSASFGDKTYIEQLVASKDEKVDDTKMNEELKKEMKELMAEQHNSFKEGIMEEFKKAIEASKEESKTETKVEPKTEPITEVKAEVDPVLEQLKVLAEAINGLKASMEAKEESKEEIKEELKLDASKVPAPKGQVGAEVNPFTSDSNSFEEELKKIDASNMTPMEKLKAKARLRLGK